MPYPHVVQFETLARRTRARAASRPRRPRFSVARRRVRRVPGISTPAPCPAGGR